MNSYRKAAELDPAWFEAQYNYAVLACRLRDFGHSLAACEMALAIQPESTEARYNFALTLKTAGYETDAVNELKKIRMRRGRNCSWAIFTRSSCAIRRRRGSII